MSTLDAVKSSCCNEKGSNGDHQTATIAPPEKSSLTSNGNRARSSFRESLRTVAKHGQGRGRRSPCGLPACCCRRRIGERNRIDGRCVIDAWRLRSFTYQTTCSSL